MNPEPPKDSIQPNPLAPAKGGGSAAADHAHAFSGSPPESEDASPLHKQIADRTPWLDDDLRSTDGIKRANEIEELWARSADRRKREAEAGRTEHEADKAKHEATREWHRAEHEPKHLRLTSMERRVFMAVLVAITLLGAALIVVGVIVNPLIITAGVAVLSGAGGSAAYSLKMARAKPNGEDADQRDP